MAGPNFKKAKRSPIPSRTATVARKTPREIILRELEAWGTASCGCSAIVVAGLDPTSSSAEAVLSAAATDGVFRGCTGPVKGFAFAGTAASATTTGVASSTDVIGSSGGARGGSMAAGSVEAMFDEGRLHWSRVTLPNIPLPLTFPATVKTLPTGCPSIALDETSSHMTLSFPELLKTILDFLISATTPVTVISDPLRDACKPLLKAIIKESVEYDVS